MNTKRRKRPVTIVDIAAKLGLSPMTVSRSLNSRQDVNEATRKRVLECATAMGYHPNRWAQSLVKRRSMIVGVVIPDIAHSFFAEITTGVEEVLERSGYDILLCHSRAQAARETSEIGMLSSSRVEGLIVASTQGIYSPGILHELRQKETPFVLVDRFFPGYDFASVRTDDHKVGRIATKYLIGLGHRRIAYIGDRGGYQSDTERLAGYREALSQAGIRFAPELAVEGNGLPSGAIEAMSKLLQSGDPPTAVCCYNDMTALGAMQAIRARGLKVPKDVSVTGFDDLFFAAYLTPPLTTVRQPMRRMGQIAMENLFKLMSGEESMAQIKVQAELIVRESTARAPKREGRHG